jgi:hypothetical protein
MKIQLPIDASAVSFIDVMPPEPMLDRQTKQQKAIGDRLGLTLRAAEAEPASAADAETGRQARHRCATGLDR